MIKGERNVCITKTTSSTGIIEKLNSLSALKTRWDQSLGLNVLQASFHLLRALALLSALLQWGFTALCHLFSTLPTATSSMSDIKWEFLICGIRPGLSHQTTWMAVRPYLGCVGTTWQTWFKLTGKFVSQCRLNTVCPVSPVVSIVDWMGPVFAGGPMIDQDVKRQASMYTWSTKYWRGILNSAYKDHLPTMIWYKHKGWSEMD